MVHRQTLASTVQRQHGALGVADTSRLYGVSVYVHAGAIIGQSVDLLLLVAGVLAALAFILFKVIIPGSKWVTTINEEIVPNVQYMKDLPKLNRVLAVVEEIAGQFRTDHGSTLKDDINRLGQHAIENKQAAAEAKQAAGDAREAATEFARTNASAIRALEVLVGTLTARARDESALARTDRDLARDALEKILALLASAHRTEESGARIEADRAVVASDLAAQQQRADDVEPHEPPGTAADAASQSPEDADDSG